MIYLDYAANTPASEDVLKRFVTCEMENPFNPNINNKLAQGTRDVLAAATKCIADCLDIQDNELVFTSSATESNNLAIKGIARHYKNRGKHIITTYLEHASVNGAMSALANEGFEIEYVDITPSGIVDLDHLQELLRQDTILVSICHVESEIGLIQPIHRIGELIKKHSKSFFHVDGTQAVGKIPLDLRNVDCYSFAAHKFYAINGCGGLVVKTGMVLEPIFHGGLSQSPFRSGTPTLGLIDAMAYGMKMVMRDRQENFDYVSRLNLQLRESLRRYSQVSMNSTEASSPYILNISLLGIKSEEFKDLLSDKGICVSTKSACCAVNSPSRPVFALTKDRKRAMSTLRISLSHLTTTEEIQQFLTTFDQIFKGVI